jgi:hypothetical protein
LLIRDDQRHTPERRRVSIGEHERFCADMQRRLAAARAEFKPYNTGVPDFFRAFSEQLRQRQD